MTTVDRTDLDADNQNPPNKDIDDQLKEVMSDPYAMAMFNDFPGASEEDKKMLLEIWKSIKNRSKGKDIGKEEK